MFTITVSSKHIQCQFTCAISGQADASMTALPASADEQFDIRSGMPGFAFRLLVGFGVLAFLSAAILVAGKLYGRSLVRAGYTSATQLFEIAIGDDSVIVPANMIRISDQRRPGLAKRLDLYVHWPSLSGFRDDLASAFNDIDPATNSIIFVSLTPRETSADMAGRFEPVYSKIVTGPVTVAGHGLGQARLSPEHGYVDEYIVFSAPDRQTGRRFAVRCQDDGATEQQIVAPCETDINFGETLNAQIRFPKRLLADWKALDSGLPDFLARLVTEPGS